MNSSLMYFFSFFFLMIRRPPRSTRVRSSAASDVYKRQIPGCPRDPRRARHRPPGSLLSLIHISEPTRLLSISYAVFCLKKKKTNSQTKKTETKDKTIQNRTKAQKRDTS